MKRNSIVLQDCFKKFTTDQDKAVTPDETLKKFYSAVDQLDINILNEVRRIDNGRLDIPVYFSVCGEEAQAFTGTKKQMGKGASPLQAEASACMELAERFSFFSFKSNPENFLVGDYRVMTEAGYPVLGLEYLIASVHDAKTSPELLAQLLEDIPMQWAWGTNITKKEDVLIPFSWFYAINEFNGPSAGNTVEEAALQGLCEIVERHVCALISHKKLGTPRIDANSVTDPVAVELLEKFAKHNIELYINDFSLDTGIPTIGAVAVDRSTFPDSSEIVYTAGTTPNVEKALIRAVTEVAQLAGDFNSHSNYIASGLPKPLGMDEVAYVTEAEKTITISQVADLSDDNIRQEVDNCVESLKNLGMDTLMINVTHPGLQIPAMYTIVPGAHFRERSMIRDVGLFSAKLLTELIEDPDLLEMKMTQFEELLPASYYVEFYRGKNLVEYGYEQDAVAHFRKALTLNPQAEDLPYIYSYLGSCLKNLGEYQEAIEILQKGLAEDEERPDIYNSLGVCYFKQEKFTEAINQFKRAVALNPSSAIDYANIGVNYNRLGEKEQAIEFLTLAVTLDSSLDFARNLLDELLGK